LGDEGYNGGDGAGDACGHVDEGVVVLPGGLRGVDVCAEEGGYVVAFYDDGLWAGGACGEGTAGLVTEVVYLWLILVGVEPLARPGQLRSTPKRGGWWWAPVFGREKRGRGLLRA
jgi:hypothetical protein